jgi:hypothetical protein
MTAEEWTELSEDTIYAIDYWRLSLLWMEVALNNLQKGIGLHELTDEDILMGSEAEPNSTWDGNTALYNLMQDRSNTWTQAYGLKLIDWCVECLRALAGWGKTFANVPGPDSMLDDKAVKDLKVCQDGYNSLCTFAQQKPLTLAWAEAKPGQIIAAHLTLMAKLPEARSLVA